MRDHVEYDYHPVMITPCPSSDCPACSRVLGCDILWEFSQSIREGRPKILKRTLSNESKWFFEESSLEDSIVHLSQSDMTLLALRTLAKLDLSLPASLSPDSYCKNSFNSPPPVGIFGIIFNILSKPLAHVNYQFN